MFVYLKVLSHDPFLRIRFLVQKLEAGVQTVLFQGSVFVVRNVRRSFVVCSHDPFFRTNKESSIWRQTIMQNLSVPFIF